ncbi:MAG: hypothetical protein ABIQ11_05165, partial [Saprospiraceae bacterium]
GTGPWTNSTGTGATSNIYVPSSADPGTTFYRVLINASNNGCEQSISNSATATITPDLSVQVQPVGFNECVGGTSQLSVVVSGGTGTVTYQWQSSPAGAGTWSNASGTGSTSALYTPPSGSSGTTDYRVLINAPGNGCGQAVSQIAVVTIDPDATVSIAPITNEVCIGGSVILTATLTGGSDIVSLQWQINNGGWSDISGQTNTTFSPSTAVAGTIQYRVRVVDAASGCSQPFSNIVTVIVQNNATVAISVNNPEVCIDGNALLTAVVTGGSSTFTLQWQSSSDNTNWSNISGATGLTYSALTSASGTTWYRILVTDNQPNCEDPTSNSVSVLVNLDPVVSISGANAEICIGGSSLLTATITGGSSQQTLQWQSDNGSGWTNIGGATGSTYNVQGNSAGSSQYRILVLNTFSGCPGTLASNAYTVLVQPDASVSVAPLSTEVCVDGVALLTATVIGGSTQLTYQWQSSPAGLDAWANISGGNSSTYNAITNVAGNTDYRVLITDPLNGCSDPVSNAVLVIVRPDATVSIAPVLSSVCQGGPVTINATIVGGSTSLTIQWQTSTDQTNWSNIDGATSQGYNPPTSLTGTLYYRVIITDLTSGCSDPVSNTASVVVSPDLSVQTQPNNITECIGGTATMTVVVTGGSGTISYQWQSSPNGTSGWVNAIGVGSTTSIFTPGSSSAGTTWYRVLINATNGGCEQAVSNTATAIITPDLSITTQPTPLTECVGGTGTISTTVNGGAGTIGYQWQTSPTGTSGWGIAAGPGSTTNTYTPPSTVEGTTWYRVSISASGSGCESILSDTTRVRIIADLNVSSQPTNITECIGGTATMTVVTSGGVGTLSYQWQASADGSTGWANASGTGSTTAIYTPPSSVIGTTFYRVLINATGNGCGQAVSLNATATITPEITISTQPTGIQECVGGSLTMTVAVTGGSGTITYQWQASPDGTSNWTNATGSGATTNIYTPISTVAGTTHYRVLVNASNPGCDQAVSNSATAVIQPDLTITSQPSNLNECQGGTAQISVVVTGGIGTVTYQWQTSPNGIDTWSNAVGTGSTTATYTPPSTTVGTYWYRLLISATGNGCGQATSNVSIVTIDQDATISITPPIHDICTGAFVNLTATITNGSDLADVQWQVYDSLTTSWVDISGATNLNYLVPSNNICSLAYRARIVDPGSGCSTPYSTISTVNVYTGASSTVTINNEDVCVGGLAVLTATINNGSGGGTSIWQSSPDSLTWSDIPGETSTQYTVPTGSPHTTFYRFYTLEPAQSECPSPIISNVALVVVHADPVVNVTITNGQICVGGTTTLTAIVTGGSDAQILQWQTSTAPSGQPWNNIVGANSETYVFTGTVAANVYFRILITDSGLGCTPSITSNPATVVIVRADAAVSISASATEVCMTTNVTLTAVVTGGSSSLIRNWQSSPVGQNTWTNISGANGLTYVITGSAPSTMDYRIMITDTLSDCSDPISNMITVTINPDAIASVAPASNAVCLGGTALLTATITGGSSGLQRQWQQSPTGLPGTWTNIGGQTGLTYNPPTGTLGTIHYRIFFTDPLPGCGSGNSNNATVTVSPDLSVTTQPSNITECAGGTATMTVAVTGGSGTISYQWQVSPNGTDSWTNATGTGATTTVYTPVSTIVSTSWYRVLINASNSGCDQAITNTASAQITPDLSITTQPSPITECVGGTNQLSVVAPGGSGTISFVWHRSST